MKSFVALAALLPALAQAHSGHHGSPGHLHGEELGLVVGLAVIVIGAIGMVASKKIGARPRRD